MKTVIEMAREAGWDMDDTVDGFSVRLERFAALARADEREACAQEAEAHASIEGIGQRIAAAIRARGNT